MMSSFVILSILPLSKAMGTHSYHFGEGCKVSLTTNQESEQQMLKDHRIEALGGNPFDPRHTH
jgi:hypothetical protein